MATLCLALYYTRANKHSFVPLLAAVESDPELSAVPIHLLEPDAQASVRLAALVRSHASVVVGFSLATAQRQDAATAVRELRGAAGPGCLFVAGGPHPSGDPEDALGLGFDLVVVGEGEATLTDLLLRLVRGEDWRGTRGIRFLDAGRVVRTPRTVPVDLDAVPCFAAAQRRYSYFEITRGCPWACAFCQVTSMAGARPRHRTPAKVAAEVAAFLRTGNRFIRFLTPNGLAYGSFDGRAADLRAVEELLRAVRAAAPAPARIHFGSFPSEVRPEMVSREAVELIRSYADNDNVVIGGQTGSDRLLDAIGRGHTAADVFRAAGHVLAAGLEACVDFILGLPGEGPGDLEQTLAAIEELAGWGARVRMHAFMPLPGTRFAAAPFGRIPEAARDRLNRLTGSGRLFGHWERQATMGTAPT